MSHFAVLVIGENWKEQLAPYDEKIEVPKYDNQADPEKDVESALNYLQKCADEGNANAAESVTTYLQTKEVDGELAANLWLLNDHWDSGWEIVDGRLVQYTTYNPKSKWDWYSVGGRWNGFFTLKESGVGALVEPHYADIASELFKDAPYKNAEEFHQAMARKSDQALKGDIDWELMRTEKAEAAAEEFDKYIKTTAGMDVPPNFSDYREANPNMDINEHRATYNQRWSDWLSATRELGYFLTTPDYFCDDAEDPRQEFIDRAVDRVGVPYAFVKNGEWIGRGEMGWFGMSSGDEDQTVWNRKVREMIDNLPDDTLLTLVDCHI